MLVITCVLYNDIFLIHKAVLSKVQVIIIIQIKVFPNQTAQPATIHPFLNVYNFILFFTPKQSKCICTTFISQLNDELTPVRKSKQFKLAVLLRLNKVHLFRIACDEDAVIFMEGALVNQWTENKYFLPSWRWIFLQKNTNSLLQPESFSKAYRP